MKFNIDSKIRAGYKMAFILLFISYLLTFYTTRQLLSQAREVNYTNNVIKNLEYLVSNIKEAETGFQNYLFRKDETLLKPYYSGLRNADSIYKVLKQIIPETSFEQRKIENLRNLIRVKFNLSDQAIHSFKNNKLVLNDYIKQTNYQNKAITDSLRFSIQSMQQNESALMIKRQNNFEATSFAIKVINITSLIIALILAIYSLSTFNTENRAKKEADKNALRYQQQLEQRVEELKIANKELVNLKSIEKFASTGRIARTIAHEVRNPITNITLSVEQLRREVIQNEETILLLDMINRNANRINQLITDLLSSTKFSQLDFRRVSINCLLDETLEFAKDRIELHHITIQKNYSNDICDVTVDSEKIKIAFLNIILNAIEAMEPGKGILKIKTETKKDKCVVTIDDNGSGIDEESLTKIFEPYFSSKAKGTGLGLTHTQNIIFNHKGSITAESKTGKGSSFIIALNFENGQEPKG